MRSALLATALVAAMAAPAAAKVTYRVKVEDATPAPGTTVRATLTFENDGEQDERVVVRARIRHRRIGVRGSRRVRGRTQRIAVTVPAGGTQTARVAVPLPARALGALALETRFRPYRWARQSLYVWDGESVPGAGGGQRLPVQPLLAAAFVREWDGAHEARTVVLRDQPALDALLDDVRVNTPGAWGRSTDFKDGPSYARPVAVDFEHETVLAIFAGTRPHLDRVRVRDVRRSANGTIVCRWQVVLNRPSGFWTMDHGYAPYLLVVIPRTETRIRFRRTSM